MRRLYIYVAGAIQPCCGAYKAMSQRLYEPFSNNSITLLLQQNRFKFCKRMITEEKFPETFSETMLKQLWKKKGSRQLLDNHRFIHLKDWKPRLTETLVTRMMKPEILKAGTK